MSQTCLAGSSAGGLCPFLHGTLCAKLAPCTSLPSLSSSPLCNPLQPRASFPSSRAQECRTQGKPLVSRMQLNESNPKATVLHSSWGHKSHVLYPRGSLKLCSKLTLNPHPVWSPKIPRHANTCPSGYCLSTQVAMKTGSIGQSL